MTIRPIDMQVIVPKVQEVGKVAQQQQHTPQASQQDLAAQLQKRDELKEKTVQQMDKPDEGTIHDHHQRQGSSQGQKQDQPNKRKNQTEEKNLDPLRGKKLDIKV